ncbi:MAG: response regulator, partial [Pseudomonadaceae bacterium]|nr:response regulator [Pseudomonadaceae bacterium]
MNVLIVDDEPLARERLSRMVGELEGYRVLEPAASNGEEALSLIDSLKPDVVLLDIRMPGLDGLQVAAKLCEREAPPAVIFCTAHDEFALEAFQVSAVGYLVKPVRAESLSEALKKAERPNRVQLAALTRPAADSSGGPRSHISAR